MIEKTSTQTIDKLTRNRIFNSRYWKEQCFALNAETIIDKAIKIKTIGGLYGGAKKPTKFLCLVFKMLQMNLPKQIINQYLRAREYKYLTAITLFYLRLSRKGAQIFEIIEPFYNDNRKLILKDGIGRHEIIYIDQFADKLLNEEVVFGIALPFLPKRLAFQQKQELQPRISILQEQEGMEEIEQQQQQQRQADNQSQQEKN